MLTLQRRERTKLESEQLKATTCLSRRGEIIQEISYDALQDE